MKKLLIAVAVMAGVGGGGYIYLGQAVLIDEVVVRNTLNQVTAEMNTVEFGEGIELKSRVVTVKQDGDAVIATTEHVLALPGQANTLDMVFDHVITGTRKSLAFRSTFSKESPGYATWKATTGDAEPVVFEYDGSLISGEGSLEFAPIYEARSETIDFGKARLEFNHGLTSNQFTLDIGKSSITPEYGSGFFSIDGIHAEGEIAFIDNVPVFPGESSLTVGKLLFKDALGDVGFESMTFVGQSEIDNGLVTSEAKLKGSGIFLPQMIRLSSFDFSEVTLEQSFQNIPVSEISVLAGKLQMGATDSEISKSVIGLANALSEGMSGSLDLKVGKHDEAGLNVSFSVDEMPTGINNIEVAMTHLFGGLNLTGGYGFKFDPNDSDQMGYAQMAMLVGFGVMSESGRISGQVSIDRGHLVLPNGQRVPLKDMLNQAAMSR